MNPWITPSSLISTINRTIMNNIDKLKGTKYMTITVSAAYRDGRFVFTGPHLDIMLHRAMNGDVEIIETDDMRLGLRGEIEGMVKIDTFTMFAGDTMPVYTDGITKSWRAGSRSGSRSISEHMYGRERFLCDHSPASNPFSPGTSFISAS